MGFEREFQYERSTKNTHRYQELPGNKEIAIGTLYIQKSAFDSVVPKRVKVRVEVEE